MARFQAYLKICKRMARFCLDVTRTWVTKKLEV